MHVETLSPAESDALLPFLAEHTDSMLYYSPGYLRLLEELLRGEAGVLVAREGDRVLGMLPWMRRGKILNSLPFYGSHGGILSLDPAATTELAGAWKELATSPDTAAATLVENPYHAPAEAELPATHVDDRLGQITPLPGGDDREEELWKAISSRARGTVRRAEREGVSVTRDDDDLDTLERFHREGMEKIGGLAKPPEFFRAIPRHFRVGEDYRIYYALRDGAKVAGLLLFYSGGTVEYFTPASDLAHRNAQPLPAILAEAMADATRRQFRHFNWGGTWRSQEGVYRFKEQWGAREHTYRYLTQVNDGSLLERTPAELLAEHPHFYVVPFSALEPS